MSEFLNELAYLHGKPSTCGRFKQNPEDFRVDEVLPFEFSGDGEHMMVKLEKTNANTPWAAKQLAKACGVAPRDVSYAGLKDRHGITTQWFSVQLPGKPNVELDEHFAEGLRVLEIQRHNRKLKRGALSGNVFHICLDELNDAQDLEARLQAISEQGVPNYFGEQRFGHEGRNLSEARAMFEGKRIRDRDKRSIYLSAARSYLFNLSVSARIEAGKFNTPLDGDVLKFTRSNAFFVEAEMSPELLKRYHEEELELTGVMWGRGELDSQGATQTMEQAVFVGQEALTQGLEQAGLKMERRALRLKAQNFNYHFENASTLRLSFFLPAGCFATSILRELVNLREDARDITHQ